MSDSKRGPRKNKAANAEAAAAAAAQAAQPASYDPAALLCKFENGVVVGNADRIALILNICVNWPLL